MDSHRENFTEVVVLSVLRDRLQGVNTWLENDPTQNLDDQEQRRIDQLSTSLWWSKDSSVSEIGAFEAKMHLPQLLERVRKGERFVITKHGNPVAELMPFRKRDPEKIRAAIEDLKAFQKAHRLGGLSVREMIEEGRKY